MKSKSLFAVLAMSSFLVAGTRAMADEYTIVIKNVKVHATTADGKSWDPDDGRPDLMVRVRNTSEKDSKAFDTKTKDDVVEATYDEPTTVKVKAGQVLFFEVYDSDTAANDLIGSFNATMSEKNLREGTFTLENFGRVIHLTFTTKKI